MVAGIFIIIVGLLALSSNFFSLTDENYIVIGLFCITLGLIAIRDAIRSKNLYKLFKKITQQQKK
jgi:uncharacterized membrane protein HdeD (DUF308 family)